MSETENKKTIAIRVDPDLRERLDTVIGILGISVNNAGIEALEEWLNRKLQDPRVREKALADLEKEEKALEARRLALQNLAGTQEPSPAAATPGKAQASDDTGKAQPGDDTGKPPAAKPASSKPAAGKPAPRKSGPA